MGVYCCINMKSSNSIKEDLIFSSLSSIVINGNNSVPINNGNNHESDISIQINQEENRNRNLALDVFEIIPENSCHSRDFDDPFDSSFRDSEIRRRPSKIISTNKDNSRLDNSSLDNNKLKDMISKRSNSSNRIISMNIFQYSEREIAIKILNEINEARLNPIKFSEKIEKYSKLIYEDKTIKKSYLSIYKRNEEVKVYLKKDKSSFLECINLLQELPTKMKEENYKLESLIQIEELKFPCPYYDLDKIDDFEFIDICISEIRNKIKGKYNLKAFHYYISFIDIEPLSVLHVVDDCNFNRTIQRAIFNPEVKYIGINLCKIKDGVYIVYYIYAF